jgi:hypothetical protein
MSKQDIAEAVMELPEKERLELARRIVASIVVDQDISGKIAHNTGKFRCGLLGDFART